MKYKRRRVSMKTMMLSRTPYWEVTVRCSSSRERGQSQKRRLTLRGLRSLLRSMLKNWPRSRRKRDEEAVTLPAVIVMRALRNARRERRIRKRRRKRKTKRRSQSHQRRIRIRKKTERSPQRRGREAGVGVGVGVQVSVIVAAIRMRRVTRNREWFRLRQRKERW